MTQRQKYSVVFYLGIAIMLIILFSGGLSRVNFSSGNSINIFALLFQGFRPSFAAPPPSTDVGIPMLEALRPIFWVMLIASIIYAIVSPRYRRHLLRTFILVLLLVFILGSLADRAQEGRESQSQAMEGSPGDTAEASLPDPPPFITDPPAWFYQVVNVLLGLLFLGAIWYLWRRFASRSDTQTLLVQEAEAALSELEAGGDLKNVVLRCYASMSRVLRQSRNIKRHKGMTPREFEQHLAEVGLQDEHIQRLTRLFEGVRYGARPVGGRTEREAMDCLRAIVQTYGTTQ